MSARKRYNKWWVDFGFNGTRYRKPSPDNTAAGAKAYEAHLRQQLARGENVNENYDIAKKACLQKQTFEEFARKWFEIDVKNNNKFSVISNKRYTLNAHLIPYFGNMSIGEIGNLHVEEYKTVKLNSGLCQKTINNHLIVLARCLNVAMEWNVLEKVPKIKRMKVAPQRYDFLTENESRQLLNDSVGTLREMILVALKTGVRLGELLAIEWCDINLQEKLLTVRQAIVYGRLGSTKSNKIRQIPLTDEVCEMLTARACSSGFIFTDNKNKPLKAYCCLRRLHKACKNAGVRKVGWHTLRHTFASHLAINNAPMKAIQELLGHSSIVTTMRYSHVNHATLQNAVKTLERKQVGHYVVTGPNLVTIENASQDQFIGVSKA